MANRIARIETNKGTIRFELLETEAPKTTENFRLLAERGIPSMIYYPVSSHKQEMLKAFAGDQCSLPVTDALSTCVISLPVHTELTEEELHFITTGFIEVVGKTAVPA